jgi:hypothetical protein
VDGRDTGLAAFFAGRLAVFLAAGLAGLRTGFLARVLAVFLAGRFDIPVSVSVRVPGN